MQKEDYLGYIAHFVKNVDQITPDDDYRKLFVKVLGTSNAINAPDAKVRDLARHFYRAYVVSLYLHYSPYYLATTLSSKQLGEFMDAQSALLDEYGLYKSIDEDLSISNVDRHIKKEGLDSYRTVLNKYLPKAAAVKKVPAKRAPKKAPAKKTKTFSKKATTSKTVPKKVKKASAKTCKELKLPELRELAKGRVKGYSKMNKAALCTALNIKG